MRIKKTKTNLELFAVSGTNTIVLSIDMKQKPTDLLGFAFERVETKSKKRIWLEGQKFFKSVIKVDQKDLEKIKGQKYPTYLHPVQSFLWKDFAVSPDTEYTYIVTGLTGSPANPDRSISQEITISTEKHISGDHGIFFNRGVSGSQSYSEQFGFDKPFDVDENVLNQKAADWLSRGLYEGIIAFIESAKKGQKIRGACYEFHYPGILLALKAAKANGVDVNVVYDAKNYGDENKAALKKTGTSSLVKHVRDNQVSQAHNKFLVLLGKNDKAISVWTGSTNISVKGIFGHCNTGHIINDKKIASKYYDYWQLVYQNLALEDYRIAVEEMKDGNDVEAKNMPAGISVFFSPRQTNNMLQTYADLIDSANEMVCCIYPFNIDKRFQTVFQKDKDYIRYILLDKRMKYNTFQTNDKDVEVTAGAAIKTTVDNWVKEPTAGQIIKSGVDFLHNKIILIDPLGVTPIVISGSANYSENSTSRNDENTLVIKGNDWVADIYFTEYVRLFDHFSFREWLNSHTKAFYPYLDETGKWINAYFDDPNKLNVKRKLIFKNMVRATEGK
jgi:phosphatidylserine/phosphatidylglycerophosphate/cardiolipin synthase-like enzyme